MGHVIIYLYRLWPDTLGWKGTCYTFKDGMFPGCQGACPTAATRLLSQLRLGLLMFSMRPGLRGRRHGDHVSGYGAPWRRRGSKIGAQTSSRSVGWFACVLGYKTTNFFSRRVQTSSRSVGWFA